MKNILIAGVLGLLSMQAFAQIDDVVNKPRSERPNFKPSVYEQVAKSAFSFILPKFESISIVSLVDEMKRDGVTERKFNVSLNTKGNFFSYRDDGENIEVLPFTVKISSDNKAYVSVSLVDVINSPDSVEVGEAFPIISMATFVLDDGHEFRDIKMTDINFFDFGAGIPLMADGPERYFALVAGVRFGARNEKIRFEDGTSMTLGDSDPDSKYGIHGGLKVGFEMKDKLGNKSTLLFRGMADFSGFMSGTEVELEDFSETKKELYTYKKYQEMNHNRVYLKPEVVLNTKLGKKQKRSVDLIVGANLALVDKLVNLEDHKPKFQEIDLKDRNRSKFNVGVRLNF